MATDADGQYRLVGDNHYHDGERLRTGDVFTPTERELEAFGFKFEPVEDDEDDVPAAAGGGDDEDPDGDGGAARPIPKDLEALSYSELQDLAQAHGIKANQSTEDLIAALREIDA